MAELLIIGFLILSALWGAHKGLLESVGGVARIAASFIGAAIAAKALLVPVTALVRPVVEKVIGQRLAAIDMSNIEDTLQSFFFASENLQTTVHEIIANVTNQGMTLMAATVESISRNVAYAGTYVVAFVALMIGLWLLMKPLELMSKLPGLNLLNWLGGGAVGLVWGALLVFVAVWAMTRFDLFLTPEMVEESQILQFFVYHSPVKLLTSI